MVAEKNAEKLITSETKKKIDFKKTYKQNRLLFPESLCKKIDTIIPSVDKFIEIYENGLLPDPPQEVKELQKENGGLHSAGIWRTDAFDDTLQQLETVSKEIEIAFRKIYGTDE